MRLTGRIFLAIMLAIGTVGAVSAGPVFGQSADKPSGMPRNRPGQPFDYTERRTPCADYDKYKQPFFGILHQHTGRSFDASLRFVRSSPDDAYRFARKVGTIITPDQYGFQTRETVNPRPLDFLAITDHSEFFGEMGICQPTAGDTGPSTSNAKGRQSFECSLLNGFLQGPRNVPAPQLDQAGSDDGFTLFSLGTINAANYAMQLPMCYSNLKQCRAAELRVWDEMQEAAERNYDRSSACQFTTFVGYENTAMPLGVTHHKNVIFRNDDVMDRPISAIDISTIPNPDPRHQVKPPSMLGNEDAVKLWTGLEEGCNDKKGRCEALTIPHNPNIGSELPATGAQAQMSVPGNTPEERIRNAQLMSRMQPLVEIFQVKGASECRYDPRFKSTYAAEPWRAQTGLNPQDIGQPGEPDEACDFEILDSPGGAAAAGLAATGVVAPDLFKNSAYMRNIFKEGLVLQGELGVNPFKLGVGSSTDDHNARPGFTVEDGSFNGHTGVGDAFPTRSASTIQNNSGGLWVAWAEENSRDSIFTALKNKETYGTSGTRTKVRFFGGWDFDDDACGQDFVEQGYELGVPMGGTLGARTDETAAPKFIAAAWKDDFVNTDLQRIQIIKGWLDAEGETHEAVFDVAVTDVPQSNPGTVCAGMGGPGTGSEHLCTVWQDPQFDPSQRAFYYVRVLEEPVCRYSTWICQEAGVDPFAPDCKEQLAQLGAGPTHNYKRENHAKCCATVTDTPDDPNASPFVQHTVQERAWTSPIWYDATSGD